MVIGYRHVGHKVKLDTGGQISYKLIKDADRDADKGADMDEEDDRTAEDALLKQLEAGLTIEDAAPPKEGTKEADKVQGMFGKVGMRCALLFCPLAFMCVCVCRRVPKWERCGVGKPLQITWRTGTWPT